MYYLPDASGMLSFMRPTFLCSGTGITGDQQYLQPEMLSVFGMFGSYFLGSGHLFQEEEDGGDGSDREGGAQTGGGGDNDSYSSSNGETNLSSFDDDDGDDNSTIGSHTARVQREQQQLIAKVIEDLRCSQIMGTMDPNEEEERKRILPDYQIGDKEEPRDTIS